MAKLCYIGESIHADTGSGIMIYILEREGNILAYGRNTPSYEDLHQRSSPTIYSPLHLYGRNTRRSYLTFHLHSFILGFIRRSKNFVFYLHSPTMASEQTMRRCIYDLEHMVMCDDCTKFCACIICDILLDVPVAALAILWSYWPTSDFVTVTWLSMVLLCYTWVYWLFGKWCASIPLGHAILKTDKIFNKEGL
jgi:hypothetical protein